MGVLQQNLTNTCKIPLLALVFADQENNLSELHPYYNHKNSKHENKSH